ncbi:MFS transporter [Tepidicaulis sp. LMO-SS28]|uniref:MFS transporter n=1 Tax=Tepidicaulis sp. LMO-SS28 TaxID=3447455 RepID=UPI003EE3FA54
MPIGILGYVLVSLFIKEIGERETRPLDWQGFLMTGIGLATLIFGFETMGRDIIPLWAVLSLLGAGAVLLALYVLHAHRAAFPLIDMGLARVPTFAAATFGGSLFRLGLGASPFLLALLLQVGFGLSPLEAGLLTFAGAAGALVMKFAAPPIIRRFGMRNVITINALIASAFFLAYALFDAETPHLVILLVLLTGGFFRSLQMTALNALAYADISPLQMSQANTLASMVQQLSLTLGVGLAALVIHWARIWNASPTLTPEDIAPAIIAVALLGAASLFFFLRLPRNAGEELNGRPLRARDKPAEIEQL